jgi:hypothetical protein
MPSAGRHRHALIPREDACGSSEIGDLCQPLAERAYVAFHDG